MSHSRLRAGCDIEPRSSAAAAAAQPAHPSSYDPADPFGEIVRLCRKRTESCAPSLRACNVYKRGRGSIPTAGACAARRLRIRILSV